MENNEVKPEYSAALKRMSKSKIKHAQFPIMEFVDARGVRYVGVLKKKKIKWKAGRNTKMEREIITGITYKRVTTAKG